MPTISIDARLKDFHLKATQINPVDLEVAANETMILDINDANYQKNLSFLEPKSIDDLKLWIGIPDQAITPIATVTSPVVIHPTVPVTTTIRTNIIIPPTATFLPEQVKTLRILARDYIYGYSSAVNNAQLPALNKWLLSQKIRIPIFVFKDIHVQAGAVLHVKSKALFANHITIERGGRIKMGNQSAIHASGIKGM